MNRMVFELVVDLLIFTTIVPLLLIPVTILWIYKQIIVHLARVLQPDLIPIYGNDSTVSSDKFRRQPGQKKLPNVGQNVGWVIRVSGPIGLKWLQQKFAKSFLDNSQGNPEGFYYNFFTRLVRFGGYSFRKPVPKLEIDSYIHPLNLGPTDNLDVFIGKWLGSPFPENAAPWEIVLISLPESNETVLAYRINHSLSDGYTMINLLDVLTGNKSPYLVKEFHETHLDKVKLAIGAPRLYWNYMKRIGAITKDRPLPLSANKDPALLSFTSFHLDDFKGVRKATGAHFMGIFLSLMGGVTRRIAMDNLRPGQSMPPYTVSLVSLPWPGHPVPKMCNHWTLGHVKVSLGPINALERLLQVEQSFCEMQEIGFNRIIKRYISNVFSLLPTDILKGVLESDKGIQMGFTALMGSRHKYELNGHPVASIHPILGTTFHNIGMVGFSYSYADRLDCTMIATQEVAHDQDGVDKVLKVYFAEELQSLVSLAKSNYK